MTPERLDAIRREVSAHYERVHYADGRVKPYLLHPHYVTQAELLDYIDTLLLDKAALPGSKDGYSQVGG